MSVFFDQTPAGTFTLTEDARAVGQCLKLHDSATNSHAMLSEKMTDGKIRLLEQVLHQLFFRLSLVNSVTL